MAVWMVIAILPVTDLHQYQGQKEVGVENTGQLNNKKENVGTQLFIENYLLQNNLAIQDVKNFFEDEVPDEKTERET